MTAEQSPPSPVESELISPEALLQTKETLLAAWSRLPAAHQTTMALVFLKEVQQGDWGPWLRQAMDLTGPPEAAPTEPQFPVINLSRQALIRAFDEVELAQLTDQDIAQIAEEMGMAFTVDPGFWYAVEMMGRRLLTEKETLSEDSGELPQAQTGEEPHTNEAGFSTWMQAVDRCVWLVAGCSVYDLPDCNFRPLFAEGVSPAEMANEVLLLAGFEMLE